jgi:hypothetical protein
MECSVCNSDFDLEGEGGTEGYFGAIPVRFCPWCLSCMIDMVDQFNSEEEIENEDVDVVFYGS